MGALLLSSPAGAGRALLAAAGGSVPDRPAVLGFQLFFAAAVGMVFGLALVQVSLCGVQGIHNFIVWYHRDVMTSILYFELSSTFSSL